MATDLLLAGPIQRRQLDHQQRTPNPHKRQVARVVKKATPKLWVDQAAGAIGYGETVLLAGILPDAWRYQLGTRSALEWVLDQYKGRTPKDRTIRAQFDTYRVADRLPELADLLARVATVSVETMRIVDGLTGSPPRQGEAVKPIHQVPAPATPQATRQLLLDFSQPAEPIAPPATIALPLSREESAAWLAHRHGPHAGDALECLMDRHGHKWDSRVTDYDTTEYWQGAKNKLGSWIISLVLSPSPSAPTTREKEEG
jgi:hypothetical protein